MDNETKNVLLQAKHEILSLRQSNSIMGAKLDGIDIAMQLLNATPQRHNSIGMGEDVAWRIDGLITSKEEKK